MENTKTVVNNLVEVLRPYVEPIVDAELKRMQIGLSDEEKLNHFRSMLVQRRNDLLTSKEFVI